MTMNALVDTCARLNVRNFYRTCQLCTLTVYVWLDVNQPTGKTMWRSTAEIVSLTSGLFSLSHAHSRYPTIAKPQEYRVMSVSIDFCRTIDCSVPNVRQGHKYIANSLKKLNNKKKYNYIMPNAYK